MDRHEFHRRRRALEELYQADLRLLRAAHEARMRSLEALWFDLNSGAALQPPSTILLSAAEDPAFLPEPAEVRSLPPDPATEAATVRNPDLRTALEEVLPDLPPVFDKKDVVQALGWKPSRSSLHRVLSDMASEGLLEFADSDEAGHPFRCESGHPFRGEGGHPAGRSGEQGSWWIEVAALRPSNGL